jgi:hypothetical protein
MCSSMLLIASCKFVSVSILQLSNCFKLSIMIKIFVADPKFVSTLRNRSVGGGGFSVRFGSGALNCTVISELFKITRSSLCLCLHLKKLHIFMMTGKLC